MVSEEKKTNNGVFLNKKRQSVPLIEKKNISHDTVRFRFGLPTDETVLGLPVGKHFKLYCPNAVGCVEGQWNGREDPEAGKKEIVRSYTPVSSDDDTGFFELVIKVYRSGVLDRFPDGGKMSQYLDQLAVGDNIDMAGPFGLIEYKGCGDFLISRKPTNKKNIGMIAGGTGITPMLQIIAHALKTEGDETKLSLIFANQTEQDILVREELEELREKHGERFELWYTLDRAPEEWEYSEGFVNAEMIDAHLPPPGDDTIVLLCGPPPMIKFACLPNLKQLGFADDACVVF
eukprot:CAMPEP_0174256422 /NCGR_PEP_ID=MMETSP0439-20130205/5653_1 /TAXON_ID=0 /ORGANISM="Stereomyxa ramosa, Strain Chinc5" /LENGTH=288 /DNA_ID=CAMNT_0015339015 /DNA_START=144 /DNA_END=1010 /DNA_ORIENTATION=+